MNLREVLHRCDRVQKSFPFKVGASALVVILGIAAFVTYLVLTRPPAPSSPALDDPAAATATLPPATQPPSSTPAPPPSLAAPTEGTQTGSLTAEQLKEFEKAKSAIEAASKILGELATARYGPGSVSIGIALATGIALIVIWLGLALTYLAFIAIAAGIAYPMMLVPSLKGYATVLIGSVILAAAFTALMAALKAILSDNPVSEFLGAMTKPMSSPIPGTQKQRLFPLPVDASVRGIAMKTVIEALRMKVSLIFIILLIFGLAALPLLIDESTPLRYRVQSFLQWGTGGSFWIIAVLTLLFGVASVAFEQRDRQIWQTMTKPVSAAQYILGKWLGLIGINAVLLAVCSAGVLLFTEYLRNQPAIGEQRQAATSASGQITEDRLLLESQVLQARVAIEPETELKPNDPVFLETIIKPYIEENQKRDPDFGKDQATFDRITADLYKQVIGASRSIAPGTGRSFIFRGLGDAKRENRLLTLRYRVDAGSNKPDDLYQLTFVFGGIPTPPQSVGLGPTHTMPLYPNVINDEGDLIVEVYNAALYIQPDGSVLAKPNMETAQFPKGGLEVSYAAGSFRANFLRVAFILWIKLAFLAMLAVTCATFLSFPVACLVAFSVFLCAEGTAFLANSLEYYDAVDTGQKVVYWKVLIRSIGLWITWVFKTYADLKPTTRLVDGRLLGWGSVAWGASLLAVWTAVLYGIAVSIFRKRELATYSGQ